MKFKTKKKFDIGGGLQLPTTSTGITGPMPYIADAPGTTLSDKIYKSSSWHKPETAPSKKGMNLTGLADSASSLFGGAAQESNEGFIPGSAAYYGEQVNNEDANFKKVAGVGAGIVGAGIGAYLGGPQGAMMGFNLGKGAGAAATGFAQGKDIDTSKFAYGGPMKTSNAYGGFVTKISKDAGSHSESKYNGVPKGNNLFEENEIILNSKSFGGPINDGSETPVTDVVLSGAVNNTYQPTMMYSYTKKGKPITMAEQGDKILKKHNALGRLASGDMISKNSVAPELRQLAKLQLDKTKANEPSANLIDSTESNITAYGGRIYAKGGGTEATTTTTTTDPIVEKRKAFQKFAGLPETGIADKATKDAYKAKGADFEKPSNQIKFSAPDEEVGQDGNALGNSMSPVNMSNYTIDQVAGVRPNSSMRDYKEKKLPPPPKDSNLTKGLLTGIQGLAGLDMIRNGLRGGDEVAFDRLNPKTVSAQPAINLARTQANRITAGTKEGIRGNAKTAGEFMAGNAAADANLLNSMGPMLAQTKYGADMGNAGIINNARQFNAQVGTQEAIARQQETDAARSAVTTGLGQLGSTAAQTGKDINSYSMDDKYKNLMGTLMDTENFKYNPATGERIIKAFGGKIKYKKR